jgi:oxidase EvaA
MIVEAGDDFPAELPDHYIWMTLSQINQFLRFNNYLNIQARSILSAIKYA